MRILEGAIYTVDEVSDLLGIPRPTLYRYLREYSIPHLRKAGRISIPEDSFDRIREARDLHREGLGTESVRRQLREGSTPDTGELDRRLDTLHQTLESLRGDIKERPATDEVALSPTLRTILARQSLLMSAMFNLTEMVEDLLLASGKRRKPLFEDLGIGIRDPLPERPARDRREIAGTVPATAHAVSRAAQSSLGQPPAARSASFGTLGRRRRRGALAILAALLFLLCLAWAIPALIGNSEPSVPRVTEAADDPPGEPKAVATAGETTSTDRTTAQESAQKSNVEVAAGGSEPEEGEVPDVSGRSLEEAAGVISGAGFEIAAIKTEASQEEPETVIGTEPSAGASARPGAPVILTMSGGPTGIPPGFQSTSASISASASASAGTSVSASAGYTNWERTKISAEGVTVGEKYDPRHISRFFDEYGEREWERLDGASASRVSFHLHFRYLCRYIKRGDHILEAGAGAGRFMIELAGLGAEITVGDVSPGQLTDLLVMCATYGWRYDDRKTRPWRPSTETRTV